MDKKNKVNERQKVIERISADGNRLYGSIDDAINYLIEMRAVHVGTDICLEEHWTGYEDMEMVFSFTRDETDDEMSRRLEQERWQRECAKREKRVQEKRSRDLVEYNRLKTRLGLG